MQTNDSLFERWISAAVLGAWVFLLRMLLTTARVWRVPDQTELHATAWFTVALLDVVTVLATVAVRMRTECWPRLRILRIVPVATVLGLSAFLALTYPRSGPPFSGYALDVEAAFGSIAFIWVVRSWWRGRNPEMPTARALR
jgi:hypothetical protein